VTAWWQITQQKQATMSTEAKKGYFGEFGGSFVPPHLQTVLDLVSEAFERLKDNEKFNTELDYYLKECRTSITTLLG
jgi:tryptophan synthase beta subunit